MVLNAKPSLVAEQAEINRFVNAMTDVRKLMHSSGSLGGPFGDGAPCKYLAMPYARLLLAVAPLRDHDQTQAKTILAELVAEFPDNHLYAVK
jgi:hypothetical protein